MSTPQLEDSVTLAEHHRHHRELKRALRLGVITISDTRTPETDESGKLIKELLVQAGHRVEYYEILPDEPQRIVLTLRRHLPHLDGIITNGGTGIAPRDTTFDAVRPLLQKELEGFGELFRMLSYQEVGPAAFLSRAVAGVSEGKLLVALPGAPNACKLAMEKLLLPELGHIAYLLDQ